MTRRLPSVVLTHPGVQQSYETVAGLQHAGMLHRFVTSVYRRGAGDERRGPWSWLPAAQRARAAAGLRKRWHPSIDARRVRTIPLPFVAARAAAEVFDAIGLRRLHGVEQLGDAGFDALAARALPGAGVTQVHAFEGAALHTLRAARRRGLATVLDVPSAHEYNLAVNEAEARATGQRPAPRFGSSARVREERRAADIIVSPSDYVSRCLVEHGVDAGRIVKIPYGADPDVFSPAPDRNAGGRFVLLNVASINHRKGTRYLLEAWRQLSLPDAELVLAGAPDAAGCGLLAQYAGSYRHLGHVPWFELPELFRSASAFVLPSLAEGSALVTYMAMASALPVVVTEDAGSVATDSCEGWVIPSGDIDTLKSKILHLYEHRGDGIAMGSAGRALIERRYTWRHYHRRIAAMHAALLDGSNIAAAVDIAGFPDPSSARIGAAA